MEIKKVLNDGNTEEDYYSLNQKPVKLKI